MKYNEDKNLEAVSDYIKSTYEEHYAGSNGIQLVDLWEAMGSLETSSRDLAMKYLMRFGKKNGKNKKDAYKAIHYILLMLHASENNFTNT